MKIHEFQAKEVLSRFGVAVPSGRECTTAEEAAAAFTELGTPVCVVKAQIHAGGRGKGGGVKVATSLEKVREYAGQILGMQLITHQTGPEGQKVRHLLIEEGADITFVEAPQSVEELRGIPAALKGTPQLVNLVVGGRTPILGLDELGEMGFSLVLYANVALQSAVYGMQAALGQLRAEGRMDEGGPVASFAERQRLVGKDLFDTLEKRYAV